MTTISKQLANSFRNTRIVSLDKLNRELEVGAYIGHFSGPVEIEVVVENNSDSYKTITILSTEDTNELPDGVSYENYPATELSDFYLLDSSKFTKEQWDVIPSQVILK